MGKEIYLIIDIVAVVIFMILGSVVKSKEEQ